MLYVDEFNDRTSGWDEEPAEQRFKKGDEYHGYVDGLYCIDAYTGPAWWFWRFPKGAFSEFTCNVVARVYGDKPDSFGKLLIGIGLEGPNGLQVGLHADGRIFVLRRDRSAEGWKNLGVRRHSAIKTGPNDFNKFVLNVRKRRVEIFINGVQVYDPVNLDWDVTPANLSLGIDCKVPNIRAEFDRIEIRELASSPATSAGDSPLETREPATKPGTLECHASCTSTNSTTRIAAGPATTRRTTATVTRTVFTTSRQTQGHFTAGAQKIALFWMPATASTSSPASWARVGNTRILVRHV